MTLTYISHLADMSEEKAGQDLNASQESAKKYFDEIYNHVHHQRFHSAATGLFNHIDLLIKYNLLELKVKNKATILHMIAIMGQLTMLKLVLNRLNNVDKARYLLLNVKNHRNQSAFDVASAECREYLTQYLNNQSTDSVEKIGIQSQSIFKQNLAIDTLYNKILTKKGVSFLNDLLDIYTDILKEKLPFTDDMLLLCVKYCRDNNNGNDKAGKMKKRLFQDQLIATVKACLNSDIKDGLSEFHGWYFSEYLMYSNYWYMNQDCDELFIKDNNSKIETKSKNSNVQGSTDDEKNSEKQLTFDNLAVFVNDEISRQKPIIKASIESAIKNEKDDWNKLVNYKNQSIESVKQPRQDEILNGFKSEYNEELFDKTQLFSTNKQCQKYNFKYFYSINTYLDGLLTRANLLNDKFQKEMSNVFVPFLENSEKKIDLEYTFHDAPVKLRQRCVDKCSSDYRNEKFPNTACLCDLLRCSFEFKSIKHLLLAIKLFEEKYKLKIVRVKNGFNQYGNSIPLEYTDIKYNVIYNDATSNISMITEVQFLLDVMVNVKKIGHNLYSVVRRQDYIHSVSKFIDLQYNGNSKYDVSISKRNYSGFGLAMQFDPKYGIFDAKKWTEASTLHILCSCNWLKGYKLFHSFFVKYVESTYGGGNNKNTDKIRKELFGQIINKGERRNDSPLIWLGFQTRETFSKINEINGLFKSILTQYTDVVEFDRTSKHKWGILSVLCDRNHYETLKLLLDLSIKHGNKGNCKIDINRIDEWGNTPLITCLKNGSYQCLSLLLDEKYKLINNDLDLKVQVTVNEGKDEKISIWQYCEENKLPKYAALIKRFDKE